MHTELATSASRTSVVERLAHQYGVDANKLLATLKATAFKLPADKQSGAVPEVTNEQMMSLLVVADNYGLNPFTKEIFAFPDTKGRGIVPVVQIGSWLGPIIFLLGFLLQLPGVPLIGLILFSGTLVFAVVTLPVELNASHRAIAMLTNGQMVSATEEQGVRTVLSAAALTYVAAVVQALSTLLYYVFLLSGSRSRR